MEKQISNIEEFIKANLSIVPNSIGITNMDIGHCDDNEANPSVEAYTYPVATFQGINYDLQLEIGGRFKCFDDDGDVELNDDDGYTTWNFNYKAEGFGDLENAVTAIIEEKFDGEDFDLSSSPAFNEILEAAKRAAIASINDEFNQRIRKFFQVA